MHSRSANSSAVGLDKEAEFSEVVIEELLRTEAELRRELAEVSYSVVNFFRVKVKGYDYW